MPEENSKIEQPILKIQRIYLKDLSFEQPNSPAIFLERELPEVGITIDVGVEKLTNEFFESTVTVIVTSKIKDQVAFLIEVKQAGIFELHNIPIEQLESLLRIHCPSIVYPYLRANLADVVTRAGFSPIHLAEINFEELHESRSTNPV